MNDAAVAQTIMTLSILIIFLGFLIWGIKSNQFRNIEDAKWQVFDNNEHKKNEDDSSGEQVQ